MDESAVEKPLSKPRWMVLASVFLSVLMLALAGVGYTSYVDGKRAAAERRNRERAAAQEREADRRWCQLLVTLDEAYSSTPPATELGRKVAGAIHTLKVDLEC